MRRLADWISVPGLCDLRDVGRGCMSLDLEVLAS